MAAVFPERRRISSSSAALIGGVPGSDGLAGDTQFIHPVSAGIGDHAPILPRRHAPNLLPLQGGRLVACGSHKAVLSRDDICVAPVVHSDGFPVTVPVAARWGAAACCVQARRWTSTLPSEARSVSIRRSSIRLKAVDRASAVAASAATTEIRA